MNLRSFAVGLLAALFATGSMADYRTNGSWPTAPAGASTSIFYEIPVDDADPATITYDDWEAYFLSLGYRNMMFHCFGLATTMTEAVDVRKEAVAGGKQPMALTIDDTADSLALVNALISEIGLESCTQDIIDNWEGATSPCVLGTDGRYLICSNHLVAQGQCVVGDVGKWTEVNKGNYASVNLRRYAKDRFKNGYVFDEGQSAQGTAQARTVEIDGEVE